MSFKKAFTYIIFVLAAGLFFNVNAHAEGTYEVTVTPENYENGAALQGYLDLQKGDTPQYDMLTITIAPGVYNFDYYMCVYSNTTIKANGATIKYTRKNGYGNGRNPILFNDAEGAYGYDGASNITVDGGVWDLQGSPGQAMYGKRLEAFRFMHCKNITLRNMTIRNIYNTHMLTIEGVDGATVTNCVFKDHYTIKQKKEAIHIDSMHNTSTAPSSQNDIKYDDTFTNNLKVSSCTFTNVPRGIGTHIAVEGCYPDNITITDNIFNNITYEAIKAYCYKNYVIRGNYINKCGIGIKAYNYVNGSGEDPYQTPNDGIVREPNPETFNGVIEKNTIISARNSEGFAIHLQGCDSRPYRGIVVNKNTITSCKKIGIYAKNCEDISVEHNTITNSSGMGIDIGYSVDSDVMDNTITAASTYGIYVKEGESNAIVANNVTQTTKQNMRAKSSPEILVSDNRFSSGKKGGILISAGCSEANVSGNEVVAAGKNGIVVSKVEGASILDNKVSSPKKYGFYILKTNATSINTNNVESSKSSGMVISKANTTNVEENTINKTGRYGILFSGTKKSMASGNAVSASKKYKVYFTKNCKDKGENIK